VKTIGFYDRGDPRGIIYEYVPESIPGAKQNTLPTHVRRRIAGLQALEGTGNRKTKPTLPTLSPGTQNTYAYSAAHTRPRSTSTLTAARGIVPSAGDGGTNPTQPRRKNRMHDALLEGRT